MSSDKEKNEEDYIPPGFEDFNKEFLEGSNDIENSPKKNNIEGKADDLLRNVTPDNNIPKKNNVEGNAEVEAANIMSLLPVTQATGSSEKITSDLKTLKDKLEIIHEQVPILSKNIFDLKNKYESLKEKLNTQVKINNEILKNFKNTFTKLDFLTKELPENYKKLINSEDGIRELREDQVNDILTKMIDYLTKMVDEVDKEKEKIQNNSYNELESQKKILQELQTNYNSHQNKIKTTIDEMLGTSNNIIEEINSNIEKLKTTSPEPNVYNTGGKRQKRNKKVTKKAKIKNNSKKRNKKTRSKKNKRTRKHRN